MSVIKYTVGISTCALMYCNYSVLSLVPAMTGINAP